MIRGVNSLEMNEMCSSALMGLAVNTQLEAHHSSLE